MWSISILAHPVEPDMAPLWLESKLNPGTRFVVSGGANICLLRDVYVWHRGSENNTSMDRVMPSFRFYTAKATEPDSEWEPKRSSLWPESSLHDVPVDLLRFFPRLFSLSEMS